MVWLVRNEDVNGWGCAHPRPGEDRRDLQIEAFDFEILTEEEYEQWLLSPEFREAADSKRILVESIEVKDIPNRRQNLPANLRTSNSFDMRVAYEIAFAPETYEDVQFRRINLWRTSEGWDEEADRNYLRTRHRSVLQAAQWYLEVYADKLSSSQKRRLRDIKRQLKAIETIL